MVIKVIINTPFGVYKETEASILTVTSSAGVRGILPNHMPLVLSLVIGKLELEENGVRNVYAIGKGLLYFADNVCRIMVEVIEAADDIDLERALKAQERALDRLKNTHTIDRKRAEIALKKAINRINVKNNIQTNK